MKVQKFKFIDGGYNGIHVEGTGIREKENGSLIYDAKEDIKAPIPEEIINFVQNLRRHFLIITRHWRSDFNKYIKNGMIIDKQELTEEETSIYMDLVRIYDATKVTGISISQDGIVISGTIESCDSKIGLATPRLTMNNYSSFEKLHRACNNCLDSVEKWITDRRLKLMSAKQYSIWGEEDQEKRREIEQMDDSALESAMVRALEDKGYIAMKHGEDYDGVEQAEQIPEKATPVNSSEEEEGVQDETAVMPDPGENKNVPAEEDLDPTSPLGEEEEE